MRYFEVLDADTTYYFGWAHILSVGFVDYFRRLGAQSGGLVTNIGYNRYGRAQLGVKATYNFTPQLSLAAIASPTGTHDMERQQDKPDSGSRLPKGMTAKETVFLLGVSDGRVVDVELVERLDQKSLAVTHKLG